MAGLVRFATFNPCSLHGGRAGKIARRMHHFDVVALPGTQLRNLDDEVPATRRRIGRHSLLSWGWSRSTFSNRSCGVNISVGPRFRNCIKEAFVPPLSLAGRCGGVRLRTCTSDLAFFAVYLPPRGAHHEDVIERCVRAFTGWMNTILRMLPNRCYPIIVGDINDQFGLVRNEWGVDAVHADSRVGDRLPGRQHRAADVLRDWLPVHDLCVASTFHHVGYTYMNGPKRIKIDHVFVPRRALHRVHYIRADYNAMRDLQLVSRSDLYDHAPVVGQVDVTVAHPSLPMRTPRICKEKVMEALLTGERRDVFVEELNAALNEFGDDWQVAMREPSVCKAWDMLSKALLQARCSDFSPGERQEDAGDVDLLAQRRALLRRRAELRRGLGGDDLEGVQLDLVLVGRRLRVLRRRRAERRRKLLLDELWSAWRRRRQHELHRVRGLLSGSGRAPRRRHLWAASRHAATSSEWASLLCRTGPDGGLDAKIITDAQPTPRLLRSFCETSRTFRMFLFRFLLRRPPGRG